MKGEGSSGRDEEASTWAGEVQGVMAEGLGYIWGSEGYISDDQKGGRRGLGKESGATRWWWWCKVIATLVY